MGVATREKLIEFWHEHRALWITFLYLLVVGGTVAWRSGGFFVEERMTVRTTAYTHSEADHLVYGKSSAAGTTLRTGRVNSAASDWSFLPVGTRFRIAGGAGIYEIDDYGGALVGTRTIDIYRSTEAAMNNWGVREVEIEILRWGSIEKSIEILEGRQAASWCREMLGRLREGVSPE